MKRLAVAWWVACLFVAQELGGGGRIAMAALGQGEATLENDRQMLAGRKSRVLRRKRLYSVHEILSESVAVREYVSESGKIFGLAWKGRTHPDLSGLLGPYYEEYVQASRNQAALESKRKLHPRGVRRPIQGERVVVEKFGHMRAMRGRAYVPSLVPSGVSSDEIH